MASRLLLFVAVGLWLYWRHLQRKAKRPRVTAASQQPRLPTSKPPHEVLGVERDATQAEIKRAYQKLVQQYHPDKVANLADELQQLAEQRTKELNAAYRALTSD